MTSFRFIKYNALKVQYSESTTYEERGTLIIKLYKIVKACQYKQMKAENYYMAVSLHSETS